VYLETFPDAEDYAQTQYFYAELLWSRAENEKNARLQTELWENAAVAFTDVVKTNKLEPKLQKEAAYAAVLGWKNALNVDPRAKQQAEIDEKDDGKGKKEDLTPKDIPEREQKMLAAFDIYIAYIKDPKDDELVGMKFLKANIYRRYNQWDKALPLFQEILDKHREHETAEYAANLLLDSYNRLGKFDDMLALADKLDKDPKFLEGKEDLAQVLKKLKAQSMRKRAEQMEANAKANKDFTQYVQCGQAYLDIYNANPEAKENDEVLYNAGVCFEEGRSIGVAIQMYSLLKKYYPDSKITAKATARLGKAFGDIAFYDRAATELENYAKKYAGEKDAYDAMSDAVFYRKGIGDDEKAIENTKYFVATFGAKKPSEAANAFFSLTSVYEKQGDNDRVVKHLKEYIGKFGNKGGADKLVIAHAKIGKILFDQSCPVKLVNGSCVRISRERAIASKQAKTKKKKGKETYTAPLQCGPESKIKLTVVPRDPGTLKKALQEFTLAGKEFAKVNAQDEGAAGARYWYALGKMAEADVEFEKYLDIKCHKNRNCGDGSPEKKGPAEKAMKQFNGWLEGKKAGAASTGKKYNDVLSIKDNANSIAAAARLGQVTQNFADQLFTAEIPAEVRKSQIIDGYDLAQDKVDAYCDALTTAAEPLAEQSLQAYGVCLSKSTELGWFSEWSKLCEHELGQIKPEDFPTASELSGESDKTAPLIAVEPAAKLD